MFIQLENNFLALTNLVASSIISFIISFTFDAVAGRIVFMIINFNKFLYYEKAVIAKNFKNIKLYIKKKFRIRKILFTDITDA